MGLVVIANALQRQAVVHEWSHSQEDYVANTYSPAFEGGNKDKRGPIHIMQRGANGINDITHYEGASKYPRCPATQVIEYATAACQRKFHEESPTTGGALKERRAYQKSCHESNR